MRGHLDAGDQAGATSRVDDLEIERDDEARLRPRSRPARTAVDDGIDIVLRELLATSPDATRGKAARTDLLTALG